jgi:hypothetical protein
MKSSTLMLAVAAALLVAAGCSTNSGQAPQAAAAKAPASSTVPAAPNASGQPMAGMSMSAAGGAAPTATALMICSSDIKTKVQQVLKLAALPRTTSSFAHGIYTCTYDLPVGPMVLSVQHAETPNAADAYYQGLKPSLGATDVLLGLGSKAYGSSRGVAVVMKDNETLVVDTRALPTVFGSDQQKRTDLANEIASDVLGCWTGND